MTKNIDEHGEYYEHNGVKFRKGDMRIEETDNPTQFKCITTYYPEYKIERETLTDADKLIWLRGDHPLMTIK